MSDLVCLVADKNMEAALSALLKRPDALGIRPLRFDVHVHPRRDPGCFGEGDDFLRSFRHTHEHGLVALDREWSGAPADTAPAMEEMLEAGLARNGMESWASVVVIDPELEVWVWSDSPHVAERLGWKGRIPPMRTWLEEEGLWEPRSAKPNDPKAAVERTLHQVGTPRSSAIYRCLAGRVGIDRCTDRSFTRFRKILQGWFPARERSNKETEGNRNGQVGE